MVKWAPRPKLYALVPPTLIGTAILFVLGFVGGHTAVENLVGREYLPAAVTASWDVRLWDVRLWDVRLKSSSKLEERLEQDEAAQPATPIIAEVKGTNSIITASTPQPAEVAEPVQAEATSLVSERSEQPFSEASQKPASEAADPPAPQIGSPPAPRDDTPVPEADAEPVLHSIVESVFGLGDTAKPEEAPAKPAEIAAQNETQRVARTINQTSNDQPNRTTAEKSEIGPAEAVRMFGEGQRLMAAGDIRQARGLFAMSLAYGMSEAALALGRSYDPSYLARIKNANAAPDAESARNWYEEWNRQSVEQDSIPSDARLDRLLQTMNAN